MSRGCLCLQLQNNLSKNQVKRIKNMVVFRDEVTLKYKEIDFFCESK